MTPTAFDTTHSLLVDLRWLKVAGILEVEEDRLRPAGRRIEMTPQESDLARRLRERYDLTRKWAIPLLERLDSEGITRRIGDERMLVGTR